MKKINCTKNQQFELFSRIAKKVDSFSIDELQSMKLGESDFNSFSKKFYTILYKGEEWEKSITNPLKKLFDGFQSDIPDHFNSFRDFLIENEEVRKTELYSLREVLNLINRMIISERALTFENRYDKSIVKTFVIDFHNLFGSRTNNSPKERKKLLITFLNNIEGFENYKIDTIFEKEDIRKLISNKSFQEIVIKLNVYFEEWDNFIISSDELKLKMIFETKKEEFCFVQSIKPGDLLVFDFEKEFNSFSLPNNRIFNLFSENSSEKEFEFVKLRIDNWNKALKGYLLDIDKLAFFDYITNKVPLFLISDYAVQNELLFGGIGFSDLVQLIKEVNEEDGERIYKIASKTLCS